MASRALDVLVSSLSLVRSPLSSFFSLGLYRGWRNCVSEKTAAQISINALVYYLVEESSHFFTKLNAIFFERHNAIFQNFNLIFLVDPLSSGNIFVVFNTFIIEKTINIKLTLLQL